MDKEQWKNEVMDSLKGIRRAEPNPFLFTRIEAAMVAAKNVTPRQWQLALAFTLALIAVNGWIAFRGNDSGQRGNAGSAYQLNNHRYEIY